MKYKNHLVNIILLLLITACSQEVFSTSTTHDSSKESSITRTLTVMTHDSFSASKEVIESFQNQHKVVVKFLEVGDTGTAVNKAVLSKGVPLADVFYGLDNTFLSRALDEGIFEIYESPYLADIPEEFQLDPQNRALPVDYGDVCINYDVNYFTQKGLIPPNSLEDLLRPEYKGLLVVENPATSSPGLSFLFATISRFGETGYLDFWSDLTDNEVKVVNDWETAYYNEFSRWGGTRPIIVSYGSSPPFEIIFSEEPMEELPTEAVVSEGSCFRQIEFVGILKGTENREIAEEFIDFMLSPPFQEDIPLQMYVFPVNKNAKLNDTFVQYLQIPEDPAILDPTDIAVNREKWIKDWTDIVLR